MRVMLLRRTRHFVQTCLLLSVIASGARAQTGHWLRHTIDSGASGADGVRLADVNADGAPDIATGWEQGGVVRVYVNPGPVRSRDRWPAVTVGNVQNCEDAVFADLDQDGAVDVVSSTEGGTKTVYVHWAPKDPQQYMDPTAWTTQAIPVTRDRQRWMFALPLDVDQKHGVDLVVGSKGTDGSVSWLEAPADPRQLWAWRLHKIVPAGWIMSLRQADVDGDGLDDVLVSDRSGPHQGVYWLRLRGPGSFGLHHIGGSDLTSKFLDVGDFNRDGHADVVVATNQERIAGFWGPDWKPFGVSGPYNKAVRVGDIDGDGHPDAVYARVRKQSEDDSLVGWIKFDGSFASERLEVHDISGPEGKKFDRIELVDLDADGDLDVLTCEENEGPDSDGLGVIWYENPNRTQTESIRPE